MVTIKELDERVKKLEAKQHIIDTTPEVAVQVAIREIFGFDIDVITDPLEDDDWKYGISFGDYMHEDDICKLTQLMTAVSSKIDTYRIDSDDDDNIMFCFNIDC